MEIPTFRIEQKSRKDGAPASVLRDRKIKASDTRRLRMTLSLAMGRSRES